MRDSTPVGLGKMFVGGHDGRVMGKQKSATPRCFSNSRPGCVSGSRVPSNSLNKPSPRKTSPAGLQRQERGHPRAINPNTRAPLIRGSRRGHLPSRDAHESGRRDRAPASSPRSASRPKTETARLESTWGRPVAHLKNVSRCRRVCGAVSLIAATKPRVRGRSSSRALISIFDGIGAPVPRWHLSL